MPGDDVFLSSTAAMVAATDGHAWLAAFLEVERALAAAEEHAGAIPAGAASRIAAATKTVEDGIDVAALAADAVVAGTPIVPLVCALRDAAAEARQWVHHGATSQDIIDTALALIARRSAAVLLDDVIAVEHALARLAHRHRGTAMVGRTLLQQGAATTFGLKAAGWLNGVLDGHEHLLAAVKGFPLQLGGAVGTLSDLGDLGIEVTDRMAAELGLPVPPLPWHTNRAPVAALAAALGAVNTAVGKIALDLVLLAQTEVAEVAERAEPGRGASSAMPHKRNPVAAVAARAAVRQALPLVQGLVASGGVDQEHERAAGAWQAEAPMVCDLFGLTAVAVDRLRDALDGLQVDEARMRTNLEHLGPDTAAGEHLGSTNAFIERVLARLAAFPPPDQESS